MKKIAILLLSCAILTSFISSKDQFKIRGHMNGVDTGMVFLQKFNMDKWTNVDSLKLEKGEFFFTGKVDLPEMWQIAMPENQVVVPFFIENADISMQVFPDSVEKSTITGSATHDIYRKYVAVTDAISKKMDVVYKEWTAAKEAHDTLAMERTDSISNSLDAGMKKQLQDFVRTNNKTVVSPYLVMRNSWQFELPELEEMVKVLDAGLKTSQYMQALQKRVGILKRVAVGQIAPDFQMKDKNGKVVKLSSMKGKILLVDFWASWCSPCRAENPNVVKAYKAFARKGFDVLGCSFDKDREKWLNAVKSDNLTWTQVSDLKGWGNAAGKQYGINSIPANVLLDKDQKIIAHNLRGADLMKKLEELLGPPMPEKKVVKMNVSIPPKK